MTKNNKVDRDKQGRYETQGENKFTEDEARKTANEHSWSNKREELLKRFGKWDEAQKDSDDE